MTRWWLLLSLLCFSLSGLQAQSDTLTTDSGLKYIVTVPGHGTFPVPSRSTVWVHYVGKFANGLIFDASSLEGRPIKIRLGKDEVIPAWEEILPKMRLGTKITLISPAELAYGRHGLASDILGEYKVPPNQDLIFEMELVKIKTKQN